MSDFEVIIYEKKGTVAWITLNRPKALNAYNIKMRDELFEVVGAMNDDPDIRVAVIRGAGGKAFCAGADLTEFLSAPPPVFARRARWARDLWGMLLTTPFPLIAAIQGYTLGSGIEISLCCDIRLCADNAKFGLPEPGLGIMPAAGGTQTMPRITGRSPALEMMLSGRWLNAAEAYKCKMVNRVVPGEELIPEAEKLAARLSNYSQDAVRAIKQATVRGCDLSLEQGIALETRLARTLIGV